MELIDTHCHLQFKQYSEPNEVIKDALSVGVRKIICVGTTLEDSQAAVDISHSNENVWAAAGVHPHDAEQFNKRDSASNELSDLLDQPRVVAVGEIGLDYYKNYSEKAVQQKAFRNQIEVGLSKHLPFIFHVRDAWEDFWKIIAEYKVEKAVVHSFSAHMEQLDKCLFHNFYVSLNGIMTFTKDDRQLEAAKKIPLDRLMLETDAPFLTPAPLRGQLCEPKHIVYTASFLANLRQEDLKDLINTTTRNAIDFFNL